MRAGKLRHKISLLRPTRVNDGKGGITTTWGTTATVWAERYELSGAEQLQAMQLQEKVTTKWRIRYRSDIQSHWKIQHGNTRYKIVGLSMDRKNTRLEISAVEE